MIAHVDPVQPEAGADRRGTARTARRAGRPPRRKSRRSGRFRVGRRVKHGLPGYEQMMRDDYEFVAILEFDDLDALKSYLAHPAHESHRAATSPHPPPAALAYDYELVDAAHVRSDHRLTRERVHPRRATAKKSSMISRRCGIDSAALIAVRRCEPLSRPLVYQEPSARSLLITHRSWPRAGCGVGVGLAGRDVPEPSASSTPLAASADRCSRAGTVRAPRAYTSRGGRPAARSAACARIHGLRSTPRPTSTPSTPPPPHPLDDLLRLDAVAAAEHRDRQSSAMRATRSQSD